MRPLGRKAIRMALAAGDVRGADGPDVTAIFTDTRKPIAGGLFVALVGENFDAHDHLVEAIAAGAGGLVVSRPEAVPVGLPSGCYVVVVDDTGEALSRLAALVRGAHPGCFAAVTGSVGKTTVKDMLTAALRDNGAVAASPGNWNNEIGVPLSLFATAGDEDFVVLELGMSAPGEIDALTHLARPAVGVITAAAAAHLAFFESVDAIADAKAELWRALPSDSRAVACADDPRILVRARTIRPRGLLTYGLDAEADFRVVDVHQDADGLVATVAYDQGSVQVRLAALGKHNAVNAAGALAAASAMGVAPELAAPSLSAHFQTASHRLEVRRARSGAWVLDDCYNANPMSTKAALDTLAAVADREIGLGAVLGSMLELGPSADELHRDVGRHAGEIGLQWLAATGPHADALAGGAREAGVESVLVAEDAMDVANEVTSFATDGRWVLLKGSRGGRLERLLSHLGTEEAV